jgi:N-acyl homoserine lactone hydrolase
MHRIWLLLCLWLPSAAWSDVKLTVFNCGELRFDNVTAFGLANEETDVREMIVPCYLIEHPRGRLLWDSGLPLSVAGQGEMDVPGGGRMSYATSIVQQLAHQGLEPADIDLLAMSHFHFDHVGGANALRTSLLLIQQTEYDAAFLHPEKFPIFDTSLYPDLHFAPKRLLNGDHDVFGDGQVMIISAPGHTPGHQVLLVRLKKTGPILLSGDLYHFRVTRELRRTPSFNTNTQDTLKSMDKVERLIKASGATLWIEHDMALARTLRLAPAFYD